MKKVLLSLLAVAALVLSCQNYDDEFDALNSKIASLESQITSLAELRTAVTGVQSGISALQSAVTAAQAAAEAADNSDAITALATSVAAIAADLVELQTAIAGATTEADLTALRTQLESTLEALRVLIQANSDQITSLVTSNADLKTQLEALGVDVDAVLAANSTFEGNLTITNATELAYAKSLGSKVASIKGDVIVTVDEPSATAYRAADTGNGVTAAEVNTVLSQITFVVGNVRISTDASLDLSALTTVSGDYSVVGHDINDSALASVGDDVYVDYDGPISFPALATADRIYVKGTYVSTDEDDVADATEDNELVTGTTSIDFMGLTKATSISILNNGHTSGGAHTSGSSAVINDSGWPAGELYLSASTTSVKINQAPVTYVEGAGLTALELHYAADKGSASLGLSTTGVAALGNLTIKAAKLSTGTVMAKQIGNITIDVVGATATTASGTVNFPEALYVGAIVSDALDHDFSKVVTTKGISLDNDIAVTFPALTASTGAISLPKATSFSADKLATVGTAKTSTAAADPKDLDAPEVTGAVTMPALVLAKDVDFAKATSFDAKSAVVTSINLSADATSLDVGSVATVAGISDIATLTTINLHAQDDPGSALDLSAAAEATSITILGKSSDTDVDFDLSTGYEELATLTLGGKLGTVTVDKGAADGEFVKLVTSGTIHQITIDDNAELATLTLGHTEDATKGSEITITNNDELTTFTTSADRVTKFVVTGNPKLGSFNASSIKTLPNNFAAVSSWTFTVTGNTGTVTSGDSDEYADRTGLKGTYTALTSTTDRAFGQASLATLKPYIQALYDKAYPSTGSATITGSNIDISFNYIVDNTPSGTTTYAVHTQVLGNQADIVAPSQATDYVAGTPLVDVSGTDGEKLALIETLKLQ
jgi:hypothetical protein